MRTVSVAEAKAKLSEVLEAAASGEDIVITRHGKPYVRLVSEAPTRPRKPIDWAEIDRLRNSMPMMEVSVVDLIRETRGDR